MLKASAIVVFSPGRTAFGTPGCMAPEQRSDMATVDHRADLYALGRTLASCIQTRHPEYVDPSQLAPPWRDIIEKPVEYDPNDRFSDAEEVIERLLNDFHGTGVLPANPLIHFCEFGEWDTVPDAWAIVAREYLLCPDPGLSRLDLAYQVSDTILANPHFQAASVFANLDAGAIKDQFGTGHPAFDDCDPLGGMIRRWYSFLDGSAKLLAFRRLCAVAVEYHRYAVMGTVRAVFESETDAALRAQMLVIIDEEDPSKVIRGKGVIPR
jgi:hypothetical protein